MNLLMKFLCSSEIKSLAHFSGFTLRLLRQVCSMNSSRGSLLSTDGSANMIMMDHSHFFFFSSTPSFLFRKNYFVLCFFQGRTHYLSPIQRFHLHSAEVLIGNPVYKRLIRCLLVISRLNVVALLMEVFNLVIPLKHLS